MPAISCLQGIAATCQQKEQSRLVRLFSDLSEELQRHLFEPDVTGIGLTLGPLERLCFPTHSSADEGQSDRHRSILLAKRYPLDQVAFE